MRIHRLLYILHKTTAKRWIKHTRPIHLEFIGSRDSLRSIKFSVKITTTLLLATTPVSSEPSFSKIQDEAHFLRSPAVREASGLAVSPTDPSFFWIINDSGGTQQIHLTNINGTARGSVFIKNAQNTDWEDLASFAIDGKSHLLIADTGDNFARRPSYSFYIIREPSLPTEGKSVSGEIPLAWKTSFTLPEGAPADIEAVAVDQEAGKILFLTKRLEPAILYSVSLKAQEKSQIAEKISEVVIKAPALPIVPFRNQPTGMDISTDNSTAAVITYYGIFLFHKNDQQTWAEVFSKRPEGLPYHGLRQAESVAFSKNSKSIYAISEGVYSPIIRWQADE